MRPEYPTESLYRAALLYCHSFLTSRHTRWLITTFGNGERVWSAKADELVKAGLSLHIAARFIETRKKISISNIADELYAEDIFIITDADTAYPPLLKHIYDAPTALFYRGSIAATLFAKTFAVVGSRQITPYGRACIASFVPSLARAGLTIISGLALGTDGCAHEAALGAGGATVAFLGCGIDDRSIYPRANVSLARRILERGGTILSEYPPRTLPLRHHFPVRNRLIAGCALGTLITEATEDSGSLITARLSLEYGRDVFAIPGSIHMPLSIGPNKLIQMGAHLALNVEDILDVLNLSPLAQQTLIECVAADGALSADEQKIMSVLCTAPRTIDEIISATALASGAAATALTMLELNSRIKHLGNHLYSAI